MTLKRVSLRTHVRSLVLLSPSAALIFLRRYASRIVRLTFRTLFHSFSTSPHYQLGSNPHPLRFGDNFQRQSHWIIQLTNSNAFHFWNWSFTTPYASDFVTLVFSLAQIPIRFAAGIIPLTLRASLRSLLASVIKNCFTLIALSVIYLFIKFTIA